MVISDFSYYVMPGLPRAGDSGPHQLCGWKGCETPIKFGVTTKGSALPQLLMALKLHYKAIHRRSGSFICELEAVFSPSRIGVRQSHACLIARFFITACEDLPQQFPRQAPAARAKTWRASLRSKCRFSDCIDPPCSTTMATSSDPSWLTSPTNIASRSIPAAQPTAGVGAVRRAIPSSHRSGRRRGSCSANPARQPPLSPHPG